MTNILMLLIGPLGALVIAAVMFWITRHDADSRKDGA